MKKCTFCAEEIQDEAILCRYCGSYLKADNNEKKQPEKIIKPKKNFWQKINEHIDNAPPLKRQGLSVDDGVRAGCGMFIVLPLLIILAIIILGVLAKGCGS